MRWLAFFHFTYVSTRSPIYHVKASQSQRLLESEGGRETQPLKSRALQSSGSFVSQLLQGDHQRARASKGKLATHRSVNDPLVAVREAETMNNERTCLLSSVLSFFST